MVAGAKPISICDSVYDLFLRAVVLSHQHLRGHQNDLAGVAVYPGGQAT